MPVVASVIVVAYNGRAYLERCLESVLADARVPCEVIVVDNASSDGSAAEVARRFPNVQVLCNDQNLGFGGASNAGAKRARGEYLAFLNQDTVVEPGWLEALVNALKTSPEAGLATSTVLLLSDPRRVNTCGCDVNFTGLTLCRGMGMPLASFVGSAPQDVAAVSGAAFAIRRSVYEDIGGFDEEFFLYVEDTDLSWRARLAGWSCLHVPASVVYHDYTLRFGPNKIFYQERNRYLMLLKNFGWRSLVALMPALLVAEVVTWGFAVRRPRFIWDKLRAYVWIVRHWSSIMDRRRKAQALRRVGDRTLLDSCTHRLAFEQVDGGLIGRLAHGVFDPTLLALGRLARSGVR